MEIFFTRIREAIIPTKCTWIMQKIRMKNPFGESMFEKEKTRIKTEVEYTGFEPVIKHQKIQ